MVAEPSPALGEVLQQLARAVGRYGDDASCADGHARWSLYHAVAGTPAALPLLFEAVALEPDGPVASAVVGDVLERVPEEERADWVRLLPTAVRGFSAQRVRELGVLESLERGSVPAEAVDDLVGGWSDWLQRRAVEVSADRDVLGVLARKGRTKRIRRSAVDARRGITA
nr:hypothetical protein StreXyl84_68570 [Streptomyces sp. Xyl84]